MDKNNRKVTTEDLARMVAKGFADTAKQKDLLALKSEMNKKFGEVD